MKVDLKEKLKALVKARNTTMESLVEGLLEHALATVDLDKLTLTDAKKRGRKPGQKAAVAAPVAEAPVAPVA